MLKFIGKIYNRIKRDQKGFTLVELMIVVVIIGILAAVIIPKFSGSSKKARDTSDEANRKVLQTAVEVYNAERLVYPKTLETLITYGYIDAIPDRQDGTKFKYNMGTDTDNIVK